MPLPGFWEDRKRSRPPVDYDRKRWHKRKAKPNMSVCWQLQRGKVKELTDAISLLHHALAKMGRKTVE